MNAPNEQHRRVPIACTLTGSELPSRVEEWQALVRDWVLETRRDAGTARLRLAPSDEALVAAVSLAQSEKECCAFFVFAIEIERDARWLSVTVPEGAEVTLDTFAEMLATP